MSKPEANVHPDARIGENVRIEPFATVMEDVEIGEGTWIGPNVTIMNGARIGRNCEIFPGAVVSAVPQDLKFEGEYTTTEIGDRTVIRECVTINRGTKDRYKTEIGSDCLLMAYVHVAHDCSIGNNCIIANAVNLAGHIVLEDWVVLEGLVAVQQFLRIGAHAFVAGASLVRKNVPPYVKAAREPLSYTGVNRIGLKRRGFSDETISTIEQIYRLLYVQNNNVSTGLEQVEKEVEAIPERERIIEFIRCSEHGIMRGAIS
jgi:UDP-N-acetylglucosamine acyltransferase